MLFLAIIDVHFIRGNQCPNKNEPRSYKNRLKKLIEILLQRVDLCGNINKTEIERITMLIYHWQEMSVYLLL